MTGVAARRRGRTRLLSVIYGLNLLLFVIASVSEIAMAQSTQEVEKVVQDTMRAWQTELTGAVKIGNKLPSVEKLMTGKYRDKARIRWGGSGDYGLCYLVDDFVQVRVEFNVRDEVISAPIVERKGAWIRQPNGDLQLDPR